MVSLALSGLIVSPAHPLETLIALKGVDFSVRP
jgi:hypothetical protein